MDADAAIAAGTGSQRPRLGSRKPRKMASSHTGAHTPTITKYTRFVACTTAGKILCQVGGLANVPVQ